MASETEGFVIIGIHGLGKKPPEANYARNWEAAIRDGLVRNLGLSPATLLFRLIYWGLWRYQDNLPEEQYLPGSGSAPYPSYVDRWINNVLADVLGAGGEILDSAKRLTGLDEAGEIFLREKLADLVVYYDDASQRTELRKLLRDALVANRGKRIMLLSHSMGTIVAYDVLREIGRNDPDFVVDHFVTLGSPLGLPYVVRKIADEWERPRVPSIVRRWSNFAERRDPIAFDVHLGDDYTSSDRDVAVRDALVINTYPGRPGPWRYHAAFGYLRTPEVSRVIRDFT